MKIVSNQYANAIVEYNRNDIAMETFADAPLNIVNEKYGVRYFPISDISIKIMGESGYAVIPKLFGLLQTANLDAVGVRLVQDTPFLALRGEGVLLGFVDTGIDYLNPLFSYDDNTTRIVSIWDQTIESLEAPANIFYYGREYKREQINEALASQEPYGIVPSIDEVGHGTMLAGIAGGAKDEVNNFQGVVPFSEIAVVKLKQAKQNLRDYFFIPDDVYCYQEDDIMFGIQYLVGVALELNRPIAICVGLGTNQGPHDGTMILSQFIAWTGSFAGRGIILAAGNEGNSRSHFFGTADRSLGYQEVELMVGENEKGLSIELWGYAPSTYSIDILSPGGQYISQILPRLGERRTIQFLLENTVAYIDYLLIEAQSGNPFILIRFTTPTSGLWKFRVYVRGSENLSFHIWLPLSNFISGGTYFTNPSPNTTITPPGNTLNSITVTAYNSVTNSIYSSASRGYTFSNVVKPDVAAPGVNVLVPLPGNLYGTASGTSIAAAYTTGIAAMLLEWGIVRGNYNTISNLQLEGFIIRGVVRDSRNTYPNPVWGYGRVNIYNTFISLTAEME